MPKSLKIIRNGENHKLFDCEVYPNLASSAPSNPTLQLKSLTIRLFSFGIWETTELITPRRLCSGPSQSKRSVSRPQEKVSLIAGFWTYPPTPPWSFLKPGEGRYKSRNRDYCVILLPSTEIFPSSLGIARSQTSSSSAPRTWRLPGMRRNASRSSVRQMKPVCSSSKTLIASSTSLSPSFRSFTTRRINSTNSAKFNALLAVSANKLEDQSVNQSINQSKIYFSLKVLCIYWVSQSYSRARAPYWKKEEDGAFNRVLISNLFPGTREQLRTVALMTLADRY